MSEGARRRVEYEEQHQLTSTYTELNIREVETLINIQTDGLDPTYSQLNIRQNELHVAKDEDPPVASGLGEMPVTAQADSLTSSYTVLKLGTNELLIDEDEDTPIASGPATLSVTAQADGLNSTYSVLKPPKDELHIDAHEDPPIASGPAELSVAAQSGAQKQEPKQNIGNRSVRKISLLCLVTIGLVAMVAGLSIYVSQTRQSLITSDRNYRRLWEQHQEMNRTQHQYQQQVHSFR
ncbi:uncharacterized protein LOC132386767 [Hypanus sabinus]|uniref:uncharacterized protein LOC132386767 n=1 Tax=Hypanus sabinus TaxID=79690 RepID=UPI0028C42930|nr:uncharacterized protein LOC132386767 [Hypanus sabinus]